MRRVLLSVITLLCVFFCASCPSNESKSAILWTDRPEFAFYAEYFNAAQEHYKIEVRYFDFPAQRLRDSASYPDIVVGSWLKSASTRIFFKPLDSYFRNKTLPVNAFYSRLLATGNIDGKQYLLPVSFNAPVMIFAKDKAGLLSNPSTIGFDEIKNLSSNFNRLNNGVYTHLGFSPAWDSNFLFITATLFNVSFREANPLAWDSLALERAMSFIYDWTMAINTSVQAEDDFTFKYFYDPPAKLAQSGRILFTHISSDALFILPEETRSNLDFRWIAERNNIPLAERSLYMGLTKKSKSPKAAAAFMRWFFQTDTQRQILERSRDNRMLETSFGIGGGFSGLRPVSEQVFPRFYPDLTGHMPPEEYLSPANILPRYWVALKERCLLPYLQERAKLPARDNVYPLERRIADWLRLNN